MHLIYIYGKLLYIIQYVQFVGSFGMTYNVNWLNQLYIVSSSNQPNGRLGCDFSPRCPKPPHLSFLFHLDNPYLLYKVQHDCKSQYPWQKKICFHINLLILLISNLVEKCNLPITRFYLYKNLLLSKQRCNLLS